MKIIFSRKGFDSSAGGCASPILPDGTLLSLPIPYDDPIRAFGNVRFRGRPLSDIVEPLTRGRLQPDSGCHLDPDILRDSLQRPPGWRPAFGQAGAAQSHLENHGIGAGDIFLFFGWFREVDADYRFIKHAPDIHALIGWLQVEDCITPATRAPADYPWTAQHPHTQGDWGRNNGLYIATGRLNGLPTETTIPGAGYFGQYRNNLRLTAPDANRSQWLLPHWFYPEGDKPPLSYHHNQSRWQRSEQGTLLNLVPRGQEFVLDTAYYPEAKQWLVDLLECGSPSS